MGTGLGLGVLLSSLGSSVLYLQQALADTVSLKMGILTDCSTLHSQFFMASVSCWLSEHPGNGWEYLLCFKKNYKGSSCFCSSGKMHETQFDSVYYVKKK